MWLGELTIAVEWDVKNETEKKNINLVHINSQQLYMDFNETSQEPSVTGVDEHITGMLWLDEFSWSYGSLLISFILS